LKRFKAETEKGGWRGRKGKGISNGEKGPCASEKKGGERTRGRKSPFPRGGESVGRMVVVGSSKPGPLMARMLVSERSRRIYLHERRLKTSRARPALLPVAQVSAPRRALREAEALENLPSRPAHSPKTAPYVPRGFGVRGLPDLNVMTLGVRGLAF